AGAAAAGDVRDRERLHLPRLRRARGIALLPRALPAVRRGRLLAGAGLAGVPAGQHRDVRAGEPVRPPRRPRRPAPVFDRRPAAAARRADAADPALRYQPGAVAAVGAATGARAL